MEGDQRGTIRFFVREASDALSGTTVFRQWELKTTLECVKEQKLAQGKQPLGIIFLTGDDELKGDPGRH